MNEQPSIERRLVKTLLAIACVAVAGVLAILPYRLYSRDIQQATTDAHRLSSLVHTSLSHALTQDRRSEATLTDLVNRLQGMGDVQVRMRRLEEGEMHPVATSGKGSSVRRDTELTYVAPPIIDREGATWIATMEFDLTPMKRRSIGLITDLVLAVVLGSLFFSGLIFVLVRRALLLPIRSVTECIGEFASNAESGDTISMPEFSSAEMNALAREVERACEARHPA